jgi:LCP family protein required for cell wall assembly
VEKIEKILKNKIFITIVSIILILGAAYLAYDQYFRLPFGKEPAPVADGEQPQEPKAEFGQFNVLIVGLDGRQGVNDRADTLILATVDGEKNTARLLSIPRDTRVKIKGGWDKVNAAYAYGGIDLTLETINDFLGIKIDRSVVLDFNSLVKLVDEVGGIEVDVPVRMYVPLEGIDLQPGKNQHLDGEQVLAYARFRGTAEGDIGRVKRQQEVIGLLLDKILRVQTITQINEMIPIYQEDVRTDLTIKEMIALARIAPKIMENGLETMVLPGENQKIDGLWFWEPDLSKLAGISAETAAGETS